MRSALHGETDLLQDITGRLPAAAFRPAPHKLWFIAAHLLVAIAAYCAFRFTDSTAVHVLLALLLAHCLSTIAFLAHELSHGSIIRSGRLRYALEVFCWGLNLIPATVWQRVHNQTHHRAANTLGDPDRQFIAAEAGWPVRVYSRLFYPQRGLPWNPLVAFHFVPYILRNTLAVFYARGARPAVVPAKPDYTAAQRGRVVFELLIIIAMQLAIFRLVGANWANYFWASPVVVLLTSAVVMAYVFTNHFLNPLGHARDPLASTTSVVVAPLFDRLHFNFSYHSEHHVFPHMNSDFYPLVSELLASRHGGRYRRMPIGEAWRRLWQLDAFARTPANKAD